MKIVFLPENKTIETDGRETLLAAASKAGIAIDGNCGGAGTCGKCKVEVQSGSQQGFHLACRLFPEGDMIVSVPQYTEFLKRKADMSAIPQDFRVFNEFEREGKSGEAFGLSFDVGTTTVVGMLWDLATGVQIGAKAEANPQAVHGADVISRIMFATENEANQQTLRDEIIGRLNSITEELTGSSGISADDVLNAVVVGNTTMSHLILGENPESLARAPFCPAFYGPVIKAADEFGLRIRRKANVTLLPNIAGHVGSDITAGIIASDIMHKTGKYLLIDVGTNGEIVLCSDGKALACSTAAGPAFEGASIYQGMRAAAGAIEFVDIDENGVSIRVVGGETPAGICGSGIVDAVAGLLKTGLVDKTGRLLTAEKALEKGVAAALAQRLRDGKTGREFLLAGNDGGEDVVITQKDVREVQLAKAAIKAGIKIMLRLLELTEEDIGQVYVAGAFGNHIRTVSAVAIGLIPDVGENRISYIGNAAGTGASMALLSTDAKEDAIQSAQKVVHVELAADPSFQDVYLAAMAF